MYVTSLLSPCNNPTKDRTRVPWVGLPRKKRHSLENYLEVDSPPLSSEGQDRISDGAGRKRVWFVFLLYVLLSFCAAGSLELYLLNMTAPTASSASRERRGGRGCFVMSSLVVAAFSCKGALGFVVPPSVAAFSAGGRSGTTTSCKDSCCILLLCTSINIYLLLVLILL